MGRIKRYRTALSRHHRSKGHGIHSPFAFNFVRFVLREKLPYYCYPELAAKRQAVIESMREVKNHPRVISLKGMKMIFRITNHFNPSCIFQVGSCYGLSEASMLSVTPSSRLWLYDPHINNYQVTANVLLPYLENIKCYYELDVAIDEYLKEMDQNKPPFLAINSVAANGDIESLTLALDKIIQGDCVIILRNLHRAKEMKQLWLQLKASMKHGQSFTNEKIAVIVANKKLNLQHYFLWF